MYYNLQTETTENVHHTNNALTQHSRHGNLHWSLLFKKWHHWARIQLCLLRLVFGRCFFLWFSFSENCRRGGPFGWCCFAYSLLLGGAAWPLPSLKKVHLCEPTVHNTRSITQMMQKNWNVMDSSRNRKHDHEAECVKPWSGLWNQFHVRQAPRRVTKRCTISDVKVSDEDSFLSCSMMIKAKRTPSWRSESGSIVWPATLCFSLASRQWHSVTRRVCVITVREKTRITPRTLPARCHKCETQWCVVEHGVKEPGAGKNTHIEIRDVVGTFFVSFHREMQCTIDYTGFQPNNVWSGLEHLGTHEHGACGDSWSEPWHDVALMPVGMKASCIGASLLVFLTLHRLYPRRDFVILHSPCSVSLMTRMNAWLKPWIQVIGIDFQLCCLMHIWSLSLDTEQHTRTHSAQPHELVSLIAGGDDHSQW